MNSLIRRISLIILVLTFSIDPILGNISVINGLKNQELVIAGPDDNYAIKELIISNNAAASVAIEIRLQDIYSLQTTLDTFLIPGNSIDTINLTLDFYHIYDLKIVRKNTNQIIHKAQGIGGSRKVILIEGHSQAAGFKGLNYNHYPGIKTVILNNNSLNWYQAVADNYSQINFIGGFAFGLAEKYHLDQGGENVLVYNHAVSGSILPDLLPGTPRFENLKKTVSLFTHAEEMVLWIGGNDAYQDNQNGLVQDSAWALFRQRMELYKDSVFEQLGIKKLFLVQEYSPVFSYYPDAEYLTGYGKELLEMRSDSVIVVPSTNGQFLGPNSELQS
ncbi:MAG: hypothetical protein KDD99_04870, partial [Bacteroidetes bacterium]|nr:hypothetical protein [Bacteroidota bacterium]